MSTSIINLILWVPFGIVAVICALIFMISGRRKGLYNALVSLGATIVAAAASLGLGKIIAYFLAPVGIKALPPIEAGAISGILNGFIESAVAMVLAMILFVVFMLILTPVSKVLFKRFVKLPVGDKKMQWGGLAVSFVDAVVFTFLLLCPFYGTAYNYLPVADAVLQMQEESEETVVACLETAKKHPVVVLSGVGPADWVYHGLAQLKTDAVSVNATALTDTVKDVAGLMQEMKDLPEKEQKKELLLYARDTLLEQKWSSELILSVGMDVLQEQVHANGGKGAILTEVMSQITITPEQFRQDGKEILDIAIGVMDMQSGKDISEEERESLAEKMGQVFSANKTVKQIKEQVYIKAITQTLKDESEETVQKIQSELGKKELSKEERMIEVQAFISLIGGGDPEEALSALAEIGVIGESLKDVKP